MDLVNKKSKLKFPLSFDLKVVMEAGDDEDNKSLIKGVFEDLKIPYFEWDVRESSQGNYRRYSVKITLISKKRMEELYSVLSKTPKVKVVL